MSRVRRRAWTRPLGRHHVGVTAETWPPRSGIDIGVQIKSDVPGHLAVVLTAGLTAVRIETWRRA